MLLQDVEPFLRGVEHCGKDKKLYALHIDFADIVERVDFKRSSERVQLCAHSDKRLAAFAIVVVDVNRALRVDNQRDLRHARRLDVRVFLPKFFAVADDFHRFGGIEKSAPHIEAPKRSLVYDGKREFAFQPRVNFRLIFPSRWKIPRPANGARALSACGGRFREASLFCF